MKCDAVFPRLVKMLCTWKCLIKNSSVYLSLCGVKENNPRVVLHGHKPSYVCFTSRSVMYLVVTKPSDIGFS